MSIDSRSADDASNDWLRMTPSTTMSGEVDLLMLVGERRRMFVPLPGCPPGVTLTPATLPWMVSIAFAAGTGASSELTRPTVNGTRVPLVGSTTPVVTTASRVSAIVVSRNSTSAVPPAVTTTF